MIPRRIKFSLRTLLLKKLNDVPQELHVARFSNGGGQKSFIQQKMKIWISLSQVVTLWGRWAEALWPPPLSSQAQAVIASEPLNSEIYIFKGAWNTWRNIRHRTRRVGDTPRAWGNPAVPRTTPAADNFELEGSQMAYQEYESGKCSAVI